jgi:hypothetical protein
MAPVPSLRLRFMMAAVLVACCPLAKAQSATPTTAVPVDSSDLRAALVRGKVEGVESWKFLQVTETSVVKDGKRSRRWCGRVERPGEAKRRFVAVDPGDPAQKPVIVVDNYAFAKIIDKHCGPVEKPVDPPEAHGLKVAFRGCAIDAGNQLYVAKPNQQPTFYADSAVQRCDSILVSLRAALSKARLSGAIDSEERKERVDGIESEVDWVRSAIHSDVVAHIEHRDDIRCQKVKCTHREKDVDPALYWGAKP